MLNDFLVVISIFFLILVFKISILKIPQKNRNIFSTK